MNTETITLLDYWRLISKYKRLIFVGVVLTTGVSAVVSGFLPKTYHSFSVIMPLDKAGRNALSVLAGQLAPLSGLSSSTSDSDRLMAILTSRTLAEIVLQAHEVALMRDMFSARWDGASSKWIAQGKGVPEHEAILDEFISHIKISDDTKTKLIHIRAEFHSPVLARDVANAFAEALQRYVEERALTKAKQNRIFIEGLLEKNKKALLEAGKELTKFYETNVISKIGAMVDANVSVNSGKLLQDNSEKIVRDVPQQVYLEYLTQHRELLGQVTSLLTQEYETAKIEESKETLVFQVVDFGRIPVTKAAPNRRLIVAIAFSVSLFLMVCLAFFVEYIQQLKARENT